MAFLTLVAAWYGGFRPFMACRDLVPGHVRAESFQWK